MIKFPIRSAGYDFKPIDMPMAFQAAEIALLSPITKNTLPRFTLERIAKITQPTLILWGRQDRLTPPSNAQLFAKDIKGSKLVMFGKLGHVPQEEDPAATVAAVQAFLSGK